MCFLLHRRPRRSTLFPYTTLFRSGWLRTRYHFPIGRTTMRPPCRTCGHVSATPIAACSSLATMTKKPSAASSRSEEHTSELQSQFHLVCRLLLEKKNRRSLHGRLC